MIEIQMTGLVKEFEVGRRVLDGFSLQVDSGERVGLLGRNGAGKTTIFRILTGQVEPDEGTVATAPGKRLGLISQIPVYPPQDRVQDVLERAFAPLRELEAELGRLAAQMGQDSSPQVLERYDALSAAFEARGGYDTQTRLNKVCNGLNIDAEMRQRLFSALSGGEKTRINLARLILEDTDILLLDEPTNHLDLKATEWLEEYLEQFSGTVLAISHDRWFLDKVVKRVVEVHDGKAELYSGNYSFYVEEKERRYQERLRQYEKEQAKIAQLEQAAQQMRLWAFQGNDKQYRRAIHMERRIERMRTTDKPTRERKLTARFGEREFHGDEAVVITGLSKSFGGRELFSGVNLEVAGGERIALLGDNGAGKSTFLKILLGEEPADGGTVYLGPSIRAGYLPQIIHFDRPERNLVDTMLYAQNCSTQQARDRLAAFHFRGEEVFKPVSALSGGEQSRLRLCMLMDSRINLLILDEPTNHLDIDSREWIEQAVAEYGGNLLFVSHDRYFIEKFADRIWMLEDGGITDFRGTYREFRAWRERRAQGKVAPKQAAPTPELPKEKPRRPGGTKELEKQVRAAERAVEKAEVRLDELSQEMEQAACDYLKLQELYQQREELEDELARLYTQWEQLAAQLEEARG
ncbi:MAG TPA: ABC-F family ATP-binding cassette domain-containing protein [Candidatus Enterenecus merdae]|nr:ABC-F family ATP-binding cassette domain-containing protein [Candidatus Enterenecus merdae]